MTRYVDTTTGALATADTPPEDTGPCEAAERCEACGDELCDEHGVGEYHTGCPDYVLCAGCIDYCADCAREAGLDRAADETLGAMQEGGR